MKCHNCGKELTDGGFCIYCGFPREEKKRASSGKLYYAAAAAVAIFTVAAAALVLLLSRAPSGKTADGAETNKYGESPSYEIAETAEARADSSTLTDEEIIQGIKGLINYMQKNSYEDGKSDYVLKDDESSRELWEDLLREAGHYIDVDPVILARENDEYYVFVSWNTTEEYEPYTYTHLFCTVYSDGRFLLAPRNEDLINQFSSEANDAALQKVRIFYDRAYRDSSGLSSENDNVTNIEKAASSGDYVWCYTNRIYDFDPDIVNKYLLYVNGTYSKEGIIFNPVCCYFSDSSKKVYVLLSIQNCDEININYTVRLQNKDGHLTLLYSYYDYTDSNQPTVLSGNNEFHVVSLSLGDNSMPDSWKDGPLEISVVDATNESSD